MKCSFAISTALMLTACHVDPQPPAVPHSAAVVQHQSPDLRAKLGMKMEERALRIADAITKYKVAVIDAETQKVQARANAEENRILEASLKDRALLHAEIFHRPEPHPEPNNGVTYSGTCHLDAETGAIICP